MFLAGLTGGIGSGKSSVSALLAARGAAIIDADLIARAVVAPGGVAYQPVIDRFGPGVVGGDGTLDRQALANLVFADPALRKELEAITHPAVGKVIAEQILAYADTERVVVLDIPLLTERDRWGLKNIIVVDCPEGVAIDRLVAQRGFAPEDARSRIDAQISRSDRLALADIVVDNSGSRGELDDEVARLWSWIERQRAVAT